MPTTMHPDPETTTPRPSILRQLLPKVPHTEEDLRALVAATAQTDYDLAIAKEVRDKALAEITEQYGARIGDLEKTLDKQVAGLRSWAVKHRADRFGDRQSVAIDGHTLRFRQSPGKLVCDQKDADLVDAILATGNEAAIEAGVALRPAPDKACIKAHIDAADDLGKQFAAMGCRVERPENFDFVPARLPD